MYGFSMKITMHQLLRSSRQLLNSLRKSSGKLMVEEKEMGRKIGGRASITVLTRDNINPQVVTMQYAVRGPILIRALKLERELQQGAEKPFKRVVKANIGDAHAMGQSPITFNRQLIACVANPALMEKGLFPSDVVEHAKVLTRENIETIIKFAHRHGLFLTADEVYQHNIYAPESKFHSFKKVMNEMGPPYNKMELASFHSVSKGYMCECGMRGGYVELFNLDPEVFVLYKKMISAKLCSAILGQIMVDALVNPPKPGEPSYDLWLKEKTAILNSLKERASLVINAFKSIDGILCNDIQGAMYAFPQLLLPSRAIEKARSLNMEPDFFYAMQLLDSTGVCIVPGSGFGQKEGTHHFRTTILPQMDLMKEMMERFKSFHTKFMQEYK
ncbi:hypothetical protein TELCIR_10465 [Teladorsagia circumcincta]|uniref:alanine transaminase n=2 Tax=Teladorsagia circumcincta TaxID=45464 RepID=A0A2G9UC71_TELCI|nr:hypothetical protein TELCIR_10465 [Teladorsagia circumcincta]